MIGKKQAGHFKLFFGLSKPVGRQYSLRQKKNLSV
jgi:hypothetical protein